LIAFGYLWSRLLSGEGGHNRQDAKPTTVDVAENGQSDTARISAACAILDRGFGKPREAGLSQYSEPSLLDVLIF